MSLTRRAALRALAAGSSAAFVAPGGTAVTRQHSPQSASASPRPPQPRTLVPLPFDPKSLKGLSERLLVSHHDNNYGGALKNLIRVEEELARVTPDTPGFLVSGLRERELQFSNSVVLHEHYFGNLGGDGRPAGPIAKALGEAFGSLGRWEELFRATGMSLAGGSGWAILDYDFHAGGLRVVWSGNHTQSAAFGAPLLVLDMYEHAYHIDFGAAAARYVDAFFVNVRWEEVDGRYERALQAATTMRRPRVS